jgi:hypothetical protein
MPKLSDAEFLERIRGRDSICRSCADAYGGEWPPVHVATFWVGKCGFCGFEKSVCCTSDYNWPKLSQKDQKIVNAKREF